MGNKPKTAGRSVNRDREKERKRRQRERERRERARVKNTNTGSPRFSPLSVKRATERERDWGTGNVLSSVHVEKGVCNAVESSGAKSQMESTCGCDATCQERRESEAKRDRQAEEKCAIGSSGSARTITVLN